MNDLKVKRWPQCVQEKQVDEAALMELMICREKSVLRVRLNEMETAIW